ncbi:winged helix-turn-helix transcriptional regulator [Lacticaseibacillus saniviri]|uniref:winged helix-turn-helix transcriptional regulator n=1 Tax=Lacticaseibacillus saniviri TaxID=931533 RepID=UPI0006D0E463|nr:winged helix-turn-helix transcriptional regulator [Lacticaseibacillus saniviri]MCG4281087.1 winged helix-turn-helix transcriptional regulator [Lacticaseibacillus saniviri]
MEKTVTVDCTQQSDLSICPKFQQTFTILGKKWNGLILEVLLQNGPSRFKDIAKSVAKCSDRVLVERLKELEGQGLVNRETHEDSALIEYSLTAKGAALQDVMEAAHTWGDTWISDQEC